MRPASPNRPSGRIAAGSEEAVPTLMRHKAPFRRDNIRNIAVDVREKHYI